MSPDFMYVQLAQLLLGARAISQRRTDGDVWVQGET
jgi:hypothetical protein